jgi:PAS domain-containing protein
MSDTPGTNLWELLWEHDPNGLVALDQSMHIRVVNPAFCRLFQVEPGIVIGEPGEPILGDLEVFRKVLRDGVPVPNREVHDDDRGLHVRQVIFAVKDHGLVACINIDLSYEDAERIERNRVKQETIQKVQRVVDNQMKVAQEIASLLGETTAETKASLLKLIRAIQAEMV